MPLGFSGMQFVNTKLEIEMLNGIRLPVVLDFDMIAVNQKNDTMTVKALSTLGSPASAADTAKTKVSNIAFFGVLKGSLSNRF